MTAPLRVAVVGAGIGAAHVRGYQALPERFEVAALCDVDAARAQSVADELHVTRIVTTLDELCRTDALDVIDICTPPHLHFEQVQQVLAAGKHAVCEKPLVSSLHEVDELGRAEARSGKRIMPIFQYRFGHGPAQRVFAYTTTRVNPIEVEDCAAVALEMADGSMASLGVTLGSATEITRHRFSFSGLVAESNTRPYTNSGDPWTFVGDTPELTEQIAAKLAEFKPLPEVYAGQFYRFYDALSDANELPVTLADARTSLELITAMYYSAETSQSVTLPISTDHPRYTSWLPQHM